MISDERYKQIMQGLGMPESLSLFLALRQLENEIYQEARKIPDSTDEGNIIGNNGPLHASAPLGMRCADCAIGHEPCWVCYRAWWKRKHPNVMMIPEDLGAPPDPLAEALATKAENFLRWYLREYKYHHPTVDELLEGLRAYREAHPEVEP